jgi:hypothetical protein
MYYQYSPDRLSTCPITIHALLHIADSIEASGPMWAYWAFPMERYCGSLVPAIRSRQFPFPSIDQYVTEVAQLTQIKMYHRLQDVLSLRPPKLDVKGLFSSQACEYQITQLHLKKSEMLHFQIPILCYSLPVIGVVYLHLLLRKL